jgi:hypothetical protein
MTAIVRTAVAACAVAVCPLPAGTASRTVPPIDKRVTYLLPQWPGMPQMSVAAVVEQANLLRARIGDGARVRVGFTTYIPVNMSPVDPSDPAAVREALAPAIAYMDAAIERARAARIPLCLSFVTAIRENKDSAQIAAEEADRRAMQWHADNSVASGWVTLSRYSRRQSALEEAFIREMGRQLAARMAADPDIIVAASGDGEVELSSDRSLVVDGTYTEATSLLADYSPFAVAEFRDWLRQGGLYAPGQVFAGEAWEAGARYLGDRSPAIDSNGDGHTLNGDFGTSFSSWDLKHFDWSLAEAPDADARAIPASIYSRPGWNPRPAELPTGFDAPRVRSRGTPWWDIWDRFRQTMVWRYNLRFAKWMTTSADPATGATVPADRWFSDQIPADYLFGSTLVNPTFRLDTSASPHWTADISPYGSLGITSFTANFGTLGFARTLAGVAPQIAARRVRWGIFEWNPSVPAIASTAPYDAEIALVERYRPSVLAPFMWAAGMYSVLGTGFETALRGYVSRRNNVSLVLSASKLYAQTTTDGAARTPPQIVRVTGEPGESPSWTATSTSPFIDVVMGADRRSFTVALRRLSYATGSMTATVTVASADGFYRPATLTVEAIATAATAAPFGALDTPRDSQIVTGELAVTGWAIDDVGVAGVDIYRAPLDGEAAQPNGLVFLGAASLVEGARPDVQGVFATTPMSGRAGWGYMLLTNMLPDRGNGIFTLSAVARDVEGRATLLGSRRIDSRNSTGVTPFGTIDTPLQGQTVAGTIVNFGWVLTPRPNCIATDGSTIDVVIDGTVVGHPVYNNPRPDIAAMFPGLCNSNAAIGYFSLDTTTLTNGVHTIAWVARDTSGAATGLGSRYFTVSNP